MIGRSRSVGMVLGITLAATLAVTGYGLNLTPAATVEHVAHAIGSNCELYPCYTINFEPSGNGSGAIQSTLLGIPDGRIDCEMTNGLISVSKCSWTYVDYNFVGFVSLSWVATAAPGSEVCYHPCAQTDSGTVVTSIAVANISMEIKLRTYRITASKTGAGTGTITSDPAGIECGASCSVASNDFSYGTSVGLMATPDAGAVFRAWTGACAGQSATCSIVVSGASSTNAVFDLPGPSPSPTRRPTPKPTTAPTTAPRPTAGSVALSSIPSPQPSPAPASAAGSPTSSEAPATTDSHPSEQVMTTVPTGPGQGAQSDPTGQSTPTDLMPIVLAILGAGLLIAVGIGLGATMLRPRR